MEILLGRVVKEKAVVKMPKEELDRDRNNNNSNNEDNRNDNNKDNDRVTTERVRENLCEG